MEFTMTPKRKIYLTNISGEERKVREQLAYMREELKELKAKMFEIEKEIKAHEKEAMFYLTRGRSTEVGNECQYLDYLCSLKRMNKNKINGIKVIIKALKKQLPSKCSKDFDCGYCVNVNLLDFKYCPYTGQKLRNQAEKEVKQQ